MSAFDWQIDGHYIGTKIGGKIQIIKCRATNMIAYHIPNKYIIGDEMQFIGEYEHLKNNYGIYFLMGDEDINDGKRGIYIGQASARNNSMGMNRLREHINSKTEKYRGNWNSAVFITTTDNSWSTGVIDTLECIFIQAYMSNEAYSCLNSKKGKLGNIPDELFNTELIAIANLLEDRFGYSINSEDKEEINISLHKVMVQMADEMRIELEAERKKYRQEYNADELWSIDWVNRVKTYKSFKQSIQSAKLLKVGGRVLGGSRDEVMTKEWVAQDMISKIPNEVFCSKSRFFEIACKSGVFIKCIIKKLMSDDPELPINHEEKYKDKLERLRHILEYQIYGVCLSENGYLLSCHEIIKIIEDYEYEITGKRNVWLRSALDSISTIPNIHYIDGYASMIRDNPKELIKRLRGKFSIEEDDEMKFDVVIGNPPYNRGMDLDFVNLGFDLSNDKCVMIIPAKWQTAKGDQRVDSRISYREFREKIVPHISSVTYFPNSLDVFDNVYQIDGITYFCADKNIHNSCEVINIQETLFNEKDKINDILKRHEGESYKNREAVFRDIKNGQSLLNIGQEIIDYLGEYRKFNPDKYKGDTSGKYKVWINNLVPGNQQVSNGGFLGVGKAYISEIRPDKKQIDCYFSSDNIKECESFLSYMNSKFVRFFLSCYYSKLTGVICEQCFSFVPAPSGEFDHIYTDDELYREFGLPQKYIDVIEAVVKERK